MCGNRGTQAIGSWAYVVCMGPPAQPGARGDLLCCPSWKQGTTKQGTFIGEPVVPLGDLAIICPGG